MTQRLLRRIAVTLGAAAIALALAACGGDDSDGNDGPLRWDSQSLEASAQGAPFTAGIMNSPNGIGVGTNRVVLALFAEDGTLVSDAAIDATVYRLAADPNAEPEVAEEVAAVNFVARTLDVHEDHQHADPGVARLSPHSSNRPIANVPPLRTDPAIPAHEDALTTVYTAQLDFDTAGWWGVALDVQVDGETYQGIRIRRFVLEDTPMPRIGEQAVATEQLTLSDVDGPQAISTQAEPVEDLLDQTVAEALQSGQPSVIAFVTPAFCQTRFCGPVLDAVVMPVYRDFGDRVNFLHIEPFELEALRTNGQYLPVQAVIDWGLETEPFIYVVDAEGIVVAAIEGITDEAELREAVEAALG